MISAINETVLALSRFIELSSLGKATLLLLIGLSATWAARRQSASTRHLLLTTTFAALLVLPAIILVGPAITLELPVVASVERNPVAESAPSLGSSGSPGLSASAHTPKVSQWPPAFWMTIARGVWIAGAISLLLGLALDIWRLRRIRREALPWPECRETLQALAAERGIRRHVELLLHENTPAPLTCGVKRPLILLPSDAQEWKREDLQRALVHELEHVRRADWLVQAVTRAICACYWFHPLIWVGRGASSAWKPSAPPMTL